MKRQQDQKISNTWFYKWILNNQAVIVVLISLLVFLTILVFTKIMPIFEPVVQFIYIIMLPLVISMLLYYLIKPLVLGLEKLGLKRVAAISVVYGILALLLVWGISSLIPSLQEQLIILVKHLPSYIQRANNQAERWLDLPFLSNYRGQLESYLTDFSNKAVDYAETFSQSALSWAGNFAGTIARVTIAVILSPFILFYLLRDSQKMKNGFVKVLPTRMRQPIVRMLGDINDQLQGYVQGQVTVAFIVGVMFSIMFSLAGLRYGVTFGIIAGILNMVPYLGSFVAMIPVVIMALVQGPIMLIKVLAIFAIEQTIEGRFVTPVVIGNKLSIHPITIMFILLTAGSLYGVWGVFLGIPIYASIKVVVKEIFEWYRSVSKFYQDDTKDVKEKMKNAE
ncbi:AI-2E family transporter [Streptococcus dentiloxodontae]